MTDQNEQEKNASVSGSRQQPVVMPDAALIHALGYARLKGADKAHMEVLAHQVSYLLAQMNVIANTYDPDGEGGLYEHIQNVRERSFKKLSAILEA